MIIIPKLSDRVKVFCKKICCDWIQLIYVDPKPFCTEWNCHCNTEFYKELYNWERVIGYYILYDTDKDKLIAVLHSVSKKDNDLIDITPFSDNRKVNLFARLSITPDFNIKEILE